MQLHLVIAAVMVMAIGVVATAAEKRASMNLACEWAARKTAVLPVWTWKQDLAQWVAFLSLVALAAIAIYSSLLQ